MGTRPEDHHAEKTGAHPPENAGMDIEAVDEALRAAAEELERTATLETALSGGEISEEMRVRIRAISEKWRGKINRLLAPVGLVPLIFGVQSLLAHVIGQSVTQETLDEHRPIRIVPEGITEGRVTIEQLQEFSRFMKDGAIVWAGIAIALFALAHTVRKLDELVRLQIAKRT